MHWRLRAFDDLPPWELARLLRARQEVFVLEQQCLYLDADGVDEHAHHLAAWALDPDDAASRDQPGMQVPLALARLVAPGVKYAEASIGRVITTGAARGSGLGRELMRRALAACSELHPGVAVRISAQSRLEAFYASMGFTIESERYLEDGIPHTEMLWRP
ncbi:MAG: GNAT family N-acetyltransferase [Ideonella sp.]|nr:GNAT family N-acetyltransferase [Ideonella sp.]